MTKTYLNNVVSGAAIRDDKGKIISEKYATKEEMILLLNKVEALELIIEELQK